MAGVPDIALAKHALAEFEVRAAEQSRQRLQEQHDSGTRWLLASLFSINAGAIVALIGADRFKDTNLVGPLGFYFAGVLFSFAMAVAVQISDRRMVAAVHGWGQVWTTFIKTGQLDADGEQKARARITDAENVGRRGRSFGLLSMLSWIVASGWALSLIGFGSK